MEDYKITSENYETFFNLNLDLACIASLDSKFLNLNSAWETTLGFTKQEMLNTSFFDFIHPDDITNTNEAVKELTKGKMLIHFQNRYRCKDGSYRWFDWSSAPSSDGKLIYAIARDITDSKKAKDDLKLRELELNEAQRLAHVGSWTLDVKTNHVFWTEELYRMYGLDPNLPPPDYTFHQTLFTQESWERLSKNLALTVEQGIPYELELEFITVNGKKGWMLVRGEALRDTNGKIYKLRGMAQDISELKIAQDKINAQNAELNALNASKDKFFSIIAHDLRSPFTGFLGLTQLISEQIENMSLAEVKEFHVTMLKSANNLYRLLDNLLVWSKMQRGLMEFYPEHSNLLSIMRSILEDLKESYSNKKINISLEIPNSIQIYADNSMLHSILRNLISNAVKFTPIGGNVCISAIEKETEIQISIQDSGIGMSSNLIEKLFRIDQKVARPGTEGEASTGLGLMLCKDFIEKHKGKIWVKSEVEKGSTFYFQLPQKSNLPLSG